MLIKTCTWTKYLGLANESIITIIGAEAMLQGSPINMFYMWFLSAIFNIYKLPNKRVILLVYYLERSTLPVFPNTI